MVKPQRLSKADAVSFLLTHIVVEHNQVFEMDPLNLFRIMSLADQAVEQVAAQNDAIPHEVMEALAAPFLAELKAAERKAVEVKQ